MVPRGAGRPRIPDHVKDDELDDYITSLILEEARMKDPAYQREYQQRSGVTAAAPRIPPNRTNKRFLSSMIRSADSFNQRQLSESNKDFARPRTRTSRWDVPPRHVGGRSPRSPSPPLSSRRTEGLNERPRSASPSPGPPPAPRTRPWDVGKHVF